MSKTTHNGSITLTSFADLSSELDPKSLPPGPSEDAGADQSSESKPAAEPTPLQDLAELIAHLANVGSGLDSMARHDAHAREQAIVELAQYESLLAEQQEAERAVAEARRLRAVAERLAAEAFTAEARAQAAHHAALARSAELTSMQLHAERARAADELAARPHLARALAERQRVAREQAEAARTAEAEREARLSHGLLALREALSADELEEAQRIHASLAQDFSDHSEVRSKADVIRWRLRQRLVAPAEAALRDVLRRPYRDDPEATVTHLSQLRIDGLPDDLARRVFGLWSNACFRLVEQRGWHEPRRKAPVMSRGAVWARPAPEAPFEVVSSLGLSEWHAGQIVPDRIALAAPHLEAGAARKRDSADSAS